MLKGLRFWFGSEWLGSLSLFHSLIFESILSGLRTLLIGHDSPPFSLNQ
ncbi:hypothetical protein NBRC111894_4095 [Sporolactobacillus inulinus]|uniref:Uncharacterized protein n=1 Tax=Sporolactobacillus inulinus TaxID=2078 RepID=A0A4Y1ZHU2_9BACL|nr:hypothetical protein NBRC111894_4095 [Sporolactobacillus inulinus]